MGKVYFLFGVHNHQPVGNFEHIFKLAYQNSYLPFLQLLDKFTRIKCSIHNSGCLYDWLLRNGKEYLTILKRLVKRKQVEIISGGYYEPILPIVPEEDKYNQIKLLNTFLEEEFGQKPQGLWVAERIWEQYLARVIALSDLKYTFLDDTHFRYAGLSREEFLGYYTTEDEQKAIFVFPISKSLRYRIPFSDAHEAVKFLASFAQDEDVLITLFDDGEKFGLWPNTFEWVYERKWLEQFFSLLSASSLIETITPSEAIKKFSSQGIIYLPSCAYEEMGEWVLEPEAFSTYERLKNFLKDNGRLHDFKDFIRGGYFRNFFHKYPRLNYMHKRMFSLSKKINRLADPERDRAIFIHLWKAQTNCSYWHGIFGGFYLGHLRATVYEHLIQAEALLEERYFKKDWLIEEEDIDLCGREEIFIRNKNFKLCFSKKNAQILEWSLKNPALNLLNTITRREESYHQRLGVHNSSEGVTTIHQIVKQKEAGLQNYLIYDTYERHSLVDLVLEKNLTLQDFLRQKGVSALADNYSCNITKGETINLHYHYLHKPLDFTKDIEVQEAGIKVVYKFKPKGFFKKHNLGIEFNLFFPSLEHIFLEETKTNLKEPQDFLTRSLSVRDNFKKIILRFKSQEVRVFIYPLYSVSSSEEGFERVYQGLAMVFILEREGEDFCLSLKIQPL